MTNIIHINQLTSYENDWKIKVLVLNKSEIKEYKNAKGPGKFQKITLLDDEGTKIQAIFFNDVVDNLCDTLNAGKTYFISDAIVKKVNPNFKNVNKEHELTLNANSKIEEVEDCLDVEKSKYNFTKLNELKWDADTCKRNELLDDIGILVQVQNAFTITTRFNVKKNKREIKIMDKECTPILLTLWKNYATNEGSKLLDIVSQNPIIAFSAVSQVEYQGGSLGTTGFTSIEINPTIPEAEDLKQWFKSKDGQEKKILNMSKEEKFKKYEHVVMKDLTERQYKTILVSEYNSLIYLN
ncbi:replication protein A 70 kDa DNA-binding subunit D-like [Macadamia integrifolia]|uniref:replication protein A 70 kDa DNA-binding subunit D-like n=1 Tax=Macadamia integrifolia TaxID=60698 RepID=UPI001C4F5ADA|nr:replication protein A 70 kDa DNA-binding subunit D-like [Macadamia integrifolia]